MTVPRSTLRVLMIDGDSRFLAIMKRGLTELGHECRCEMSMAAGLLLLSSGWADIALVDANIRCPATDHRAPADPNRPRTPILLSTSFDAPQTRSPCVLPADDYIVKPFGLTALVERMEAVLSRF